jgi:hypothetical protein
VRVRFTPEALLAIREKRAWWQEHRKEAPRLFAEELGAIVAKLRSGTDADRQKYAARGGHIIWRVLMPRTRNHVYYRVLDAGGDVEVLLVWNAIGERTPDI